MQFYHFVYNTKVDSGFIIASTKPRYELYPWMGKYTNNLKYCGYVDSNGTSNLNIDQKYLDQCGGGFRMEYFPQIIFNTDGTKHHNMPDVLRNYF